MKTIYYRYELWEDYQNGMYHTKSDGREEIRKEQALIMFKDTDLLYKNMKYVAEKWQHSAEVNFTNPSINYQAWLGQASNCYYTGCSDIETTDVWHMLTEEEQNKANAVADKVYNEWIKKYQIKNGNYQFNLFDKEVYQ